MEYNARLSFVRITPRKMGLIADEIRGKDINSALTYLKFSPRKRTAEVIAKLLKSAVANANAAVDVDSLFVKTILVGKGTTLKRFMPRAKGSAFPINKRTSHVSVTLAQRN